MDLDIAERKLKDYDDFVIRNCSTNSMVYQLRGPSAVTFKASFPNVAYYNRVAYLGSGSSLSAITCPTDCRSYVVVVMFTAATIAPSMKHNTAHSADSIKKERTN